MAFSIDAKLPFDGSNPHIKKFTNDLLSPFKQRFFLITKLPSAWFMGVKIKNLDENHCDVSLKYSWWSQNPFQSIYFAAQAAAAELSTGAIALMAIQGRGKISMLVANMEASFLKKATQTTIFTCLDTQSIFTAVEKAIATQESQTVKVESIGTQADGVVVSKFSFTWTFKAKN